jgi:hypothetical protein
MLLELRRSKSADRLREVNRLGRGANHDRAAGVTLRVFGAGT